MHYQLTLHLASEKKDYYWLFNSQEDTVTIFNEVIETFKHYEPKNSKAFIKENQREIDETGRSNMVQIEVVKVDKEAIIRSASYNEMMYEGRHFKAIYNILTNRLGPPEEESIA
ncbi:hypothetical protein [Planomicrobium sp. CPCC 101079]|uniref:hypothetical protein n=1 Tax=Planomicrobium sp. CPCC 101079 TaxID=2599618 RepID=UPI0011B3BF82|nr:hypothetical protein [Planomicrobium sp. CPCC 101079]TWT01585.1 hypothetical protein FQV28_16065 [Planomicrobium sp. CPCC 101079]